MTKILAIVFLAVCAAVLFFCIILILYRLHQEKKEIEFLKSIGKIK